jgi:predicted enzyme related to lactoylglutathione lyase
MAAADVSETFFSLQVEDMARATAFYVGAFGAIVVFSSPGWSSLRIAGVRVGLALSTEMTSSGDGLHFAVRDLAAAASAVEGAGGRIESRPIKVAPAVVIVRASDTEGNMFTLTASE